MLPPRIRKPAKEGGRWKSRSHCDFIRSHACCVPGCDRRPIEVAHLRNGTDAGMGRKASDFYAISLCAYHHRADQHMNGEVTFAREHGIDLHELADAFAKASPKAREIAQIKREREL